MFIVKLVFIHLFTKRFHSLQSQQSLCTISLRVCVWKSNFLNSLSKILLFLFLQIESESNSPATLLDSRQISYRQLKHLAKTNKNINNHPTESSSNITYFPSFSSGPSFSFIFVQASLSLVNFRVCAVFTNHGANCCCGITLSYLAPRRCYPHFCLQLGPSYISCSRSCTKQVLMML